MQERVLTLRAMLLLSLSGTVSLAGCGANPTTEPAAAVGAAMQGQVLGGEQPITGAVIQLYAVGNSGNGSAATSLIHSTVTSGAGGNFAITGDYTCPTPSSTPVYLTATGGNPGLTGTVNNTAIALVDALGPCSNLTSSTHIIINEATTAAAAWALSPFATSLANIGASATNLTGITNAFATAGQLADPASGASPGSSIPANTEVESAKLYSLADILASCVSSNGSGAPCSGLFTDVTPTGGTLPSDTFGAALSVVKHPGNNVAKIFMNHVGSTPPFPALAAAPNDWTMSITYTVENQNETQTFGSSYASIAFDQNGNLWMIEGTDVLVAVSHLGVPLLHVTLSPFTDGNNYFPSAVAIDGSNNVWLPVPTILNSTPSNILPMGTVLEFDTSGNLKSAAPGYSGGGIDDPTVVAADTDGNIWLGDRGVYLTTAGDVYAGGGVSLLTSSGAVQSPGSGYDFAMNFDPVAMAIDSNHTAWFASESALGLSSVGAQASPFVTSITNPGSGSATITQIPIPDQLESAIAIDTNNNVWFTSNPLTTTVYNDLGEINNLGSLVTDTITGGGLVDAASMSIDTANTIWIANYNRNNLYFFFCSPDTIAAFSAGTTGITSGTALSPAAGYGNDANICSLGAPPSAVDSSGSLWLSGITYVISPGTLIDGGTEIIGAEYVSGITTFVGIAAPVKTPRLGPPQAP